MTNVQLYILLGLAWGVVWTRYVYQLYLSAEPRHPEGVALMQRWRAEFEPAPLRLLVGLVLCIMAIFGAVFWMPMVAWYVGGLLRRSA